MMNFKGEFTRFENPEDSLFGNRPPTDGGMIYDSAINGEGNTPIGSDNNDKNPFILPPPDKMPTPFK